MKLSKKFTVDPEKSFTQLYLLWFGVVLIVSLSIAVGVTILCHENLSFELDGDGFNNFVQIYKFPLGILAVIIPYIAFIATTHRSVQAKEQIILSRAQNNFSNYFKHLEEFEKFTHNPIFDKLQISDIRKTHELLFPKADIGNYAISSTLIIMIDEALYSLRNLISKFQSGDNDGLDEIIFVDKSFQVFFSLCNIELLRSGRNFNYMGTNYTFVSLKLNDIFSEFVKYSRVLHFLFSFDKNFSPSQVFSEFLNMDIEDVPKIDISTIEQGKVESFNVFINNSK
jgi:hypothetical protein